LPVQFCRATSVHRADYQTKPKPDSSEIKNVWQLLTVNHDSLIELRAISPTGFSTPNTEHYRIQNCKSPEALKDAFELHAIRLNNDGCNIYKVLNPNEKLKTNVFLQKNEGGKAHSSSNYAQARLQISKEIV